MRIPEKNLIRVNSVRERQLYFSKGFVDGLRVEEASAYYFDQVVEQIISERLK